MSLRNQIVVITGSSRGLGLEIARSFARLGARLVLAARGETALRAAERELARLTEVLAVQVDVSENGERLIEAAIARFGRVDVLINNASSLGPSPMPRLESLHYDAMTDLFRVNATAPLHLAQLVLPGMKARGHGTIINVSSDAGVNAYPGWGGYGSSKAALEHLSRTLAAELADTGIRVYVVDPGDMNTRMHQEAEPGVDISHLPSPAVSAPIFAHLVEQERAPFGRFEAQKFIAAPARDAPRDAEAT